MTGRSTAGASQAKRASTSTGRAAGKSTVANGKSPGAPAGSAAGKASSKSAGKTTSGSASVGAASATKAPAKRESVRAGKGRGPSSATRDADGASADSSTDGVAQRHITAHEAMENTRELLAAKQSRARRPPAWQELDTTQHFKAGTPGFESEAARDRAVDLHQDEMRLQANEGSISDRDHQQQGRRDSR
jgi:hypothetical protein